MKRFNKRKYLIISIIFVVGIIYFSIRPTNDADWSLDQKILPSAIVSGNLVTIENVRNFRYTSTSNYIPNYYTGIYDLNKIKSVDYIVEPFGDFGGAAHTFLSFGFEGNENSLLNCNCISIEFNAKNSKKNTI